jgi:hypothetical protein
MPVQQHWLANSTSYSHNTFQALGLAKLDGWTPTAHAVTDLPLPETPEAAILVPQLLGIRGISDKTEHKRGEGS